MEDSQIKSKIVYNCNSDIKMNDVKNITKISQLSQYVKEYNFGDLVVFDSDRATAYKIIGKGGKLINNEDNTHAGYLSIPYEITQYLDNAVEMYCHSGLSVNDIEIRYDDKYIKDNVNTEKCKILEEWNWKIGYCHDMLWIEFPNGKGHEFAIGEKAEDILSWYKSSELEQVKI